MISHGWMGVNLRQVYTRHALNPIQTEHPPISLAIVLRQLAHVEILQISTLLHSVDHGRLS